MNQQSKLKMMRPITELNESKQENFHCMNRKKPKKNPEDMQNVENGLNMGRDIQQ